MITKTKLKVGHIYKVKKMQSFASNSGLSEKEVWIDKIDENIPCQHFYYKHQNGSIMCRCVETKEITRLGLKDMSAPALSLFLT